MAMYGPVLRSAPQNITATGKANNYFPIIFQVMKHFVCFLLLHLINVQLSIDFLDVGHEDGSSSVFSATDLWLEPHNATTQHLDPAHNVSSPEFKAIANITYNKVNRCIIKTHFMRAKNANQVFTFPDDAQEHFEEILKITEPFRHVAVHEYAGYEGPWIENIFIAKFIHVPLYRYRGFIPIFVQWIDSQILRGRLFGNILAELNKVLRPNVIYLAISQGDAGLAMIGRAHPNILVMSAGGFGHIPIPLIKGELPLQPFRSPKEFAVDIGFYGNPRQKPRYDMLPQITQTADTLGLTMRQAQGSEWMELMNETKFNLAPRGYGRSSFRFAETIQMGRMPVFLYDDMPWVPYEAGNISLETFGLRGRRSNDGANTLDATVSALKNMSDEEFTRKMEHLRAVIRPHFTYRGVFRQIAMFLNDPFGPEGGHLRCTYHPATEFCCG